MLTVSLWLLPLGITIAIVFLSPVSIQAMATTSCSSDGTTRSTPKLVAFDLDGTIWAPDMYMLWGGGAPFRTVSNDELRDRSNQKVKLLGVSGKILDDIATKPEWSDTIVAWVSCTDEPQWADECMKKFRTPMGVPLVDRVQEQCIYKANKQSHFRDLKQRTNIDFSDMVFFDNENGNIRSVSKLGVRSIYCPQGMTEKIWKQGIEAWRQQQ